MVEQIPVIVLATLFLHSGLAKLRCTRPLQGTLLQLGAPRAIASAAGRALPVVEISAAALVLLTDGPLRAVFAGLLALVAAAGAVAAVRSRGKKIGCACFGPGDLSTLGPQTAIRNAAVVLLGVAVAISPAPSAWSAATTSWPAGLGAVLLAALTVAVVSFATRLATHESTVAAVPGLLHAAAQMQAAAALGHDLLPRRVPDLALLRQDGTRTTLEAETAARPQLLLVVSTGCSSCAALLPHVPFWQDELRDVADVRALSRQSLCAHPTPDELPQGSLFALDQTLLDGWVTTILAQGTPALCVIGPGRTLTHDALSPFGDMDQLRRELTGLPSS